MLRATRWSALACLLLPAGLSAAAPDPWLKITSANFELYSTAPERAGRDLIRHFEQVRSFFTQAFGTRLSAGQPARIIAFRNEKEYQPYRPNEFASAFYQPGAAHDFIVMSSASGDHYPVAIHEFTHLMTHQSSMDLPPWLNEGLAELYSTLEPRGNKILVGQVIPGRVQVLNTGKWIPLATLLEVDHNSPYYNEKSRAGMFYAESWALVHMLHLEPEYRNHLNALALALKDQPPAAAFFKTYGKSIDEIEAALRTYFQAATIHAELFNIQLPKSVDTPEVEPAAALPARIALAELTGNTRGRAEQSRTAWEQLAKDFPASCQVEAAWGEFTWRQRKLTEAAAHFARAVELGCKSETDLLLYARVLAYDRRDKDAVAVLTEAERLYPDSNEVNLELGAALVRTASYGAALGALVSVKKVATAEQAYRLYYNLAYAKYRLSDAEHARESLAKARTYTKNAGEIASLDRLSQAIERTAPAFPTVEGTLEEMECGTLARLHVRVDGAIRIFLMPDPTKVSVHSGSGEAVALKCGPQNPPRAVHIEYQDLRGTSALVRTLEFQ